MSAPLDEAFTELSAMIDDMLRFRSPIVDSDAGVRSMITAYEIETPIELDVVVDVDGAVRLGSIPPLYRVDTSFRPSFHSVRFRAELNEEAGE